MDSRDPLAPSKQGTIQSAESPSFASRLLSRAVLQRKIPNKKDEATTKNISQVSEREYQRSVYSYASLGTTSEDAYDPGKHQSSVDPTLHVHWKGLPFWGLTWELFGILASICFIVLGACIASLKNQPESDWSNRIVQAMRVAPSVWPIVFSGIMGNAVRSWADWQVERGTTLMSLEQLMGSLTMAGSWITIFKWSLFRLSSIALVILWAFNPLGSQASFRGAYLTDSLGSGTGRISYYNYNLSTQMALTEFQYTSTRAKPTIRALYSSVLYDVIASTQYVDQSNSTFQDTVMMLGGHQSASIQAATDPWGNLRIPYLELLEGYDSSDSARWIDVPWNNTIQNYVSLVGDRIEGVERNFTGNTTFEINSSYLTFNCSPWSFINEGSRDRWALDTFGQNWTAVRLQPSVRTYRSFIVMSPGNSSTLKANSETPKIVFASIQENPLNQLATTSCSSRTTYIDAKVHCMSKGLLGKANCGVSAMRKSQRPSDPPEMSLLQSGLLDFPNSTFNLDPFIASRFHVSFMDFLDDNQSGSGQSSVVERYIQDPLTALKEPKYMTYTQLGDLDIKVFEKRFGLLYNTLWKIGWTHHSVTGANLTTAVSFDTRLNTTSNTIFLKEPVYAINVPWMVLYFFSVGVMFFAALFSLATHSRCRAPSILGYVSSLVRDSTYFHGDGAQGNSVEGGAAKAKRLGDMRVMIADVKGDEVVGKVAFAPAESGKRVKPMRWYE